MFQELSYGPWYPAPQGVGPRVRPKKLVDQINRSVKLRQTSLRRSDSTVSFRDAWLSELGDPQVPIVDDISLSAVPSTDFLRSYWTREAFSKLDVSSKEEEDRLESEAVERLLAKERLNVEINQRLRHFALTGRGLTPETAVAVRQARKSIERILGKFSWDRCIQYCRWGPGASTEFSRVRSMPQNKWAVAAHITADCVPLLETFSLWSRWEFPVEIVGSNRITTVPKKTTARRTIATEPTWNMFFQLGIEGAIRRCLQKQGLLVDSKRYSAQDRHKNLARAGSRVPGLFPTLDFKDASNSITRGLCGLLLPDDWLSALVMTRSKIATLPDGSTHSLEMFSTMGNGYTFVLMTLIIYAVSTAVVGSQTSVFGDDLILPDAEKVEVLVRIFGELGFSLNLDKSFYRGPFRESCGGHYFRGCDVTPPYFKRRLDNVPAYVSYANAIWRREPTAVYSDLWRSLLNRVPRSYRGPEGYGDSVAVCPWDMATPRWSKGLQSWYGSTLVGYYPTRDGLAIGRLRNDLYPFKVGEGPEVDSKRPLKYRTGTWLSSGW